MLRALFMAAFFHLPTPAVAQVIFTYPGKTLRIISGLTSTSYGVVGQLEDLAIGPDGSVYYSDLSVGGVRRILPNGDVVQVAGPGSGQAGFSGDGGPAIAARFSNPRAVAVDATGNVYVADSGNRRVRKVNTNGIVTTVLGNGEYGWDGIGGPATQAQIYDPEGLAVAANGDLYVSDIGRILKVDSSGIVTHFAGNPFAQDRSDGLAAKDIKLGYLYNLAFDNTGSLHFAENGSAIRKIDASGVVRTVLGEPTHENSPAVDCDLGIKPRCLKFAHRFSIAANGNVIVADSGNHRMVSLAATGVFTHIAGTGVAGFSGDGGLAASAALNRPFGTVADAEGSIYIADSGNRRIRKVVAIASPPPAAPAISLVVPGPQTVRVHFAPPAQSGSAPIDRYRVSCGGASVEGPVSPLLVYGLAAGVSVTCNVTAGNAFGYGPTSAESMPATPTVLVRLSAEKIVTVAGNIEQVSGYTGVPATDTNLHFGVAIAVDSVGRLFIGERWQIRVVDRAGIIHSFSGFQPGGAPLLDDGAGRPPLAFAGIAAMAFDRAGNLYVADDVAMKIFRIGIDGSFSAVAGNGQFGPTVDGLPATEAAIGVPRSVAIDAAGNLNFSNGVSILLVDGNGVLRAITPLVNQGGYSGDGDPALGAQFNDIGAIAFDGDNYLLLHDRGNQRIRSISPDGIVRTIAGNGPLPIGPNACDQGALNQRHGQNALNVPVCYANSIIADRDGNIYFSETLGVRMINSAREFQNVAGGTPGFSGDGGAAEAAQLNFPSGLDLDASGNLYVLDAGNKLVRKILLSARVPDAPRQVGAMAGIASVTLPFDRPEFDGGAPISRFDATCGNVVKSAKSSPIVVDGLAAGQAVTCTVAALNLLGVGTAALAASVTPSDGTPRAPTVNRVVPGNGLLTIEFYPPTDVGGAPIIDFVVDCGQGSGLAIGNGSPIHVGGLSNGVQYQCTVRARNSYGQGEQTLALGATPQSNVAFQLLSVTSRKQHGTAGMFEVDLFRGIAPSGSMGIEPRSAFGLHDIVFRFNSPIDSVGTVSVKDVNGMEIGQSTTVLTEFHDGILISLSGIPDGTKLSLSLAAFKAGVDPLLVTIGFLVGDVNGDGKIGPEDLAAVKAQVGRPLTPRNFIHDLNLSARITAADAVSVKARQGRLAR